MSIDMGLHDVVPAVDVMDSPIGQAFNSLRQKFMSFDLKSNRNAVYHSCPCIRHQAKAYYMAFELIEKNKAN